MEIRPMSTRRSGHHGWHIVVATAALSLGCAARAQDAAPVARPATPSPAAAVARAAADSSPRVRPDWLAINRSAMAEADGTLRDDGVHALMNGTATDAAMRDAVNIPGALVADGVRIVDGRIQLFSSAADGARVAEGHAR
jgi:hypothetical protein